MAVIRPQMKELELPNPARDGRSAEYVHSMFVGRPNWVRTARAAGWIRSSACSVSSILEYTSRTLCS